MSRGDVSLAQAGIVVDELVGAGMRHACISPGSRSTPLALALARDERVTVHVHLDERSSAFFALGIAKTTRRPVGVLCTSGTAAAEFFPAVVEAFQSRAPLVLLTADRPARLRGTGANQTIDQRDLYGRFAMFAELPLPAEPVPSQAVRALIRAAMTAASGGGPVHLNAPFDEPLMPEGAPVDVTADDSGETPEPTRTDPVPTNADIDALAEELSGADGVVVLGSAAAPFDAAVLGLAAELGWPVLAEPVSGARVPRGTPADALVLAAGVALAGSAEWLSEHRPGVVLRLGSEATSRATLGLVASAERSVVIGAHLPSPNPDMPVTLAAAFDPSAVAARLAGRLAPAPEAWLAAWQRADDAARAAMDAELDAFDEPFEPRVARDLAAAVPDGGALWAGSSTPVRDLDLAMAPRRGLRVFANRGASGIDGFVSTVLGGAAAAAEEGAGNPSPVYALMGDLTFLHDAGGLLWLAGRPGLDAVLVTLDNDGGGIFSLLPQRDLPEHESLFRTPHGLDLRAVCEAARAGHSRVERASDLLPELRRAEFAGGVQVLHVPVPIEASARRRETLRAAVEAAIAGAT
jgi:2-succinyl-5-enolpyruvyl-6-hydroxy-3-cyclohexene-1-carboxylate synthase